MSKVYCKNCKYHKLDMLVIVSCIFIPIIGWGILMVAWILSLLWPVDNECWFRVKSFNCYTNKTEVDYIEQDNSDGECQYYIRKWWKFWIKDK